MASKDKQYVAQLYYGDTMWSTRCATEYHHSFDFDATGKHLKEMLSACNMQKDGTLKVAISFKPNFTASTKKINKQEVSNSMAAVVNHVHHEIVAECEYCGKPLTRSEVNDFGTLCERCYQREYYDN